MTMAGSLVGIAKSVARPPYRWLRRLSNKLLHGRRRERSLRAVRGVGVPNVILFICYGNICRSPYAAYSASQRLPAKLRDRIQVISAGSHRPGRPSPKNALDAGQALGVDLGPHRSQLLTRELVDGADLIFAMDTANSDKLFETFGPLRAPVLLLGKLDSDRSTPPEIADPYDASLDVFEQTYRRIDRCVMTLIQALERSAKES